MRYRIGQQVSYIPNHIDRDDFENPSIEDGYIERIVEEDKIAYVRYFRDHGSRELRTKSCAERTPFRNLLSIPVQRERDEGLIRALIQHYEDEKDCEGELG